MIQVHSKFLSRKEFTNTHIREGGKMKQRLPEPGNHRIEHVTGSTMMNNRESKQIS